MNDHDIDLIATALNRLRPDWPTRSIRTLIASKLADRPKRDVAVALTWVACEPGTATPARVLEAGPWWKAAAVEGTLVPRHATPDTFCQTCGRELGDCCDRPTRKVEPVQPKESAHVQTVLADARAALAATKVDAQGVGA